MKNNLLLQTLALKPTRRRPIWLMRQAGRYLPEYREVRKRAGDFLTLCKTPDLAVEVTMQPIARFGFDAAIIFSDILTIPDALNLDLSFQLQEGPVIGSPIVTLKDVENLPSSIDIQRLSYVFEAIKIAKHELINKVPLLGFAGSPWTLATYMVEGGTSKAFTKIKALMYKEPATMKLLLGKIRDYVVEYLAMQIEAGADALMLFDTWGGVLSYKHYLEFSLNYMEQIVAKLRVSHPSTPIILFTKNSGKYLDKIMETQCHGIGLDWTADISNAVQQVGSKVVLQGNLDPCALFADKDSLTRYVNEILAATDGVPGHIFNLGHGIDKDTPIENVELLVDIVKNYNIKY